MAVITDGLYKIVLEQLYQSQVLLNTFFYESTLGSDDLQEECATAFDEDILPILKVIQHTTLTYVTVRAINVTGTLADFLLTPVTTAGILIGVAVNSFTAYGIRLNRTTKETRNGQKRFGGTTEESMAGQIWTSGTQTNMQTLADKLAVNIDTVGGVFKPVIARQDPLIPANWTVNDVASGAAATDITTQVSRKRGVGA